MTDTNELRKLLAAATPLPWAVSYEDESWEVVQTKPDGTPDLVARRTAFDDGSAYGRYAPSCNGPTRDLIVAAVNSMPAMLDELDAARAEVGRLRADLREAVELLRLARGRFQSYEECDQDYCADGSDHEPRARMDALLAKHKETP